MVIGRRPGQVDRPGAVALTGTPTVQGETTGERERLDALTVDELRQLCDERGLPRSGTKPELVDRLLA